MKHQHKCICFSCNELYSVKDHRDDKKCPHCSSEDTFVMEINAHSAGMQQTGAAPLSPPTRCDSSSRLTKKQESTGKAPCKVVFGPPSSSVSPYPPVKYEWEEWDR